MLAILHNLLTYFNNTFSKYLETKHDYHVSVDVSRFHNMYIEYNPPILFRNSFSQKRIEDLARSCIEKYYDPKIKSSIHYLFFVNRLTHHTDIIPCRETSLKEYAK